LNASIFIGAFLVATYQDQNYLTPDENSFYI